MEITNKAYLGDGVYMYDENHHIVLETIDRMETTNQIFMDSYVLLNFINTLGDLRSLDIRVEKRSE